MASTVQTTAVALRRGTTSANDLFTGVQGELVVDLGADGTGTDVNTTLRLHNAITTGGIPMARADMANVASKALATNRTALGEKNLAYADLSNIETASDASRIISILSGYGFAQENSIETLLVNYAKADMSNVNTANLATAGTGHSGKNLGYADMSNVDTANLATGAGQTGKHSGKDLAYADLSNVDMSSITGNFAAADLSNVTTASWNTIKIAQGIESSTNKDTVIDANNIVQDHYPTTQAVVDYVGSGGGGGDLSTKMNVNFSNASTWDLLYSNDAAYYQYKTDGAIVDGGTGFIQGNDYYTGITLSDDRTYLAVDVTAVDSSGNITSAKVSPEFGATDLTSHNVLNVVNNQDGSANVTFTSTLVSTGLYRYSVSNITTVVSGGFTTSSYEDQNGTSTVPVLFVKAVTVGAGGAITSYKFKPEEGSTDITGTITISSGVSGATDAEITASTVNTFPPIGGANLLKTDLTNLPGMSNGDALVEQSSDWRIRHNLPIPTSPVTPGDPEYYRIVTAGLVADAIAASASGDLKNTATGTNGLTIDGVSSTANNGINIGYSSKAQSTNALAIGIGTEASGQSTTAIGAGAKTSAHYAIQIGYGTNSNASTLSVGFNAASTTDRKNWVLLDGITGQIPGERMALQGTAAPTTSTVGSIGQFYIDTTNEDGYMCVGVSGSTYTWKQITI